MNRVILVFIDGLGIGGHDPAINPLAAFQPEVLRVYQKSLGDLPRGGCCLATDAQMGVLGIPQSATGQTALLTGTNASAYLGRHLSGFPNQVLKDLIREQSLFRKLKKRGFRVTFANTYNPRFFEQRPRWVSVSTVMCETAEVRLWRIEDLRAGRSLFMDFTNGILRDRGFEVPVRTPQEAARILVGLAENYDFCFYEYFLTDLVGHRGVLKEAVALLQELDAFLLEVVHRIDLEQVSLVVCSDHGNIEKMDQKGHTTNLVPTLLWGGIQEVASQGPRAFSLQDVAPLIESFLGGGPRQDPSESG